MSEDLVVVFIIKEERKGEVAARAHQGFYKSLKVKVSARASQGQTNGSQGQGAPHFLRARQAKVKTNVSWRKARPRQGE